MNEGQYLAIRSYLEELTSQGRQLIEGQARTNELLERAPLIVYTSGDANAEQIAAEVNAAMNRMLKDVAAPPYTGTLETEPPPDGDGIMPPPTTSKPKASAKKGK